MFNANVKGLPRIIFHKRLEKLDNRDQKLMLRLWFDRHFVYLMRIETINAHLYVHQMQRVDKCLIEKQPVFIKKKDSLVNENARTSTSKMTQEKILELDWSVLSHLSYSPDLTSNSYCYFKSLQNALLRKTFFNEKMFPSKPEF